MKVPQQIEVTRTVAMMKIRTAGAKDRQARLAAGLSLLNEAQGWRSSSTAQTASS